MITREQREEFGVYIAKDIATELATTAAKLNKALERLGIYYRHNKNWYFRDTHSSKGYGFIVHNDRGLNADGEVEYTLINMWTKKGKDYIIGRLTKTPEALNKDFVNPNLVYATSEEYINSKVEKAKYYRDEYTSYPDLDFHIGLNMD